MPRRTANAGFTLAETIVAVLVGSVVLAAIFSSYLFLGRNLTRLAHQAELEVQGRQALQLLAEDVRMAIAVTSASDSALTLTVQAVPSGTATVTYTYDSPAQTLSRTHGAATRVLLRDVTSFDFNYYDARAYYTSTATAYANPTNANPATTTNASPTNNNNGNDLQSLAATNGYTLKLQSIKQVAVTFTCERGKIMADNTVVLGTRTRLASASSRLTLRNTGLLDQP